MINPDSLQSIGGKARAAKLSEEKLSEIAKKGALARWGARPIQAIRKGNFREHFGIDVDCYVLGDAQKTAVLSERGMGRALGLSDTGGNKLKTFLSTKAMAPLVGPEVQQKLSQPITFQWGTGGPDSPPPTIVNGFDVTMLIDVCEIITRAETNGTLSDSERNKRVVAQARIILAASARSGIKGLVYALAGYNPTEQEVIAAFKMYVLEEAKKYEKEFPDELYAQWQRIYNIPIPVRGKPWNFKHLTVRHIYYPLAQSSGKLLQLMRAIKAKGGEVDRRKKLFQFLSELGARALRMHIGRVLEMAESSPTKSAYEQKIVQRFGGQQELDFVIPPIPVSQPDSKKDDSQLPLKL